MLLIVKYLWQKLIRNYFWDFFKLNQFEKMQVMNRKKHKQKVNTLVWTKVFAFWSITSTASIYFNLDTNNNYQPDYSNNSVYFTCTYLVLKQGIYVGLHLPLHLLLLRHRHHHHHHLYHLVDWKNLCVNQLLSLVGVSAPKR